MASKKTSSDVPPLWPRPIEVIGGTGEFESGKTTFGVTICPGPETLVYDFEKSSKPYEDDLGFVRVDVPDEMGARPGKSYKPIDTFQWWLAHVQSIKPGTYRVIMADPASDIESGIVDYVNANPREFNKTAAQYTKMQALMWGDMKAYWKRILADIASRCETFYFTTHQQSVWKNDRPSKERKAKGKETLFEMASLYLKFQRNKDKDIVPSAIVLKSRLSKMVHNPTTGHTAITPLMPPRLPIATPFAIRQYMLNPPDFAHLKPEEQIGTEQLTEDERLQLKANIAEAERDTALAQTETRRRSAVSRPKKEVTESTEETTEPTEEDVTDASEESDATEESEESTEDVQEAGADDTEPAKSHGEQVEELHREALASSRSQYADPAGDITPGQLKILKHTIDRFIKAGYKKEAVLNGIKKRNPKATKPEDLTQGQANDLDAAIKMILDGPHAEEESEVEPVATDKS